jgi:hypothetical protein
VIDFSLGSPLRRFVSAPGQVLDSMLILIFHEIEGGKELELIHANVPDFESDGVKEGWKTYYWQPWKAYIKNMK